MIDLRPKDLPAADRLRFAPSPTGELHLGNARTALFNYLLAQNTGGTLIFRSEDTDRERSSTAHEAAIMADLDWLGLDWDEGPREGGPCTPYRQSEASEIYGRVMEELKGSGNVYPCFCSKEQLDEDRKAQQQRKEAPRYIGRCREIDPERARARIAAGEPHVWRLRFPAAETEIRFDDMVRGEVVFKAGNLGGDMILIRTDGSPIFHLAVVVDDHRMGITHVLRGEDHLTNTAKQLLLFEAMGWAPPRYGHMAMILGPDKAKLSKRHGGTSVGFYRDRGVLPEALFNYLSLLGWSPGDDTEIMATDEIVRRFTVDRLIKSAAVFDERKLLWLNGQHLRALAPGDYLERATAWLAAHAREVVSALGEELLARVLPIYQDGIESFADLPSELAVFQAPELAETKHERKVLRMETLLPVLDVLEPALESMPEPGEGRLEWFAETAGAIEAETEAGGRKLFQPLRLAITGRAVGPDLKALLQAMPMDLVKKRISLARQAHADQSESDA